MKWALLVSLLSLSAWSRPVVLISYFDAFDKAPFNNSERVARALDKKLSPTIDIKLCALNTVFDKSYTQMEDCLKTLSVRPDLVIGLGETGCDLKIEMVARNEDKTKGPDNEGNERHSTPVIAGAPQHLALRYPLPQMYCALDARVRSEIDVSNYAGTFVCNNLAYQMAHHYEDLHFGFIHVPANNCRGLESKTEQAIVSLEAMIKKGVEFLDTQFFISPTTPHSSNQIRLPLVRAELEAFRKDKDLQDKCQKEFFKRARGVDEKGFWSFLEKN